MKRAYVRCRSVQISNLGRCGKCTVKKSNLSCTGSLTAWHGSSVWVDRFTIFWLQILFGCLYWEHFIAYCMHIICRASFSTLWILTVQIKHSLLICFCKKTFTFSDPLDLCHAAELKSHGGQAGRSRKNDYSNQRMYTFCCFCVCWLSAVVPLLLSWMTEDIKFSIRNSALVISQWASSC